MIKKRSFPDKNYKAIYHDFKTLRMPIDPKKPVLELEYPEFYDVKITNQCGGLCPYCYQNSVPDEPHYSDILDKAYKFFCEGMTKNQRPFQVAIGGGNPNEHPDFLELLWLFDKWGITPNYTTNGMNITDEHIEGTKKLCGGVAITTHPHLTPIWEETSFRFYQAGVMLNFHVLIGSIEDIERFKSIFKTWESRVAYFVLLPVTEVGRASHISYDKDLVAKTLISEVAKLKTNKVAFGANYYQQLLKYGQGLDISMYEPEILSKYLDLKDMKVYKSSFNLTEAK